MRTAQHLTVFVFLKEECTCAHSRSVLNTEFPQSLIDAHSLFPTPFRGNLYPQTLFSFTPTFVVNLAFLYIFSFISDVGRTDG
jgi:hypothetical protein